MSRSRFRTAVLVLGVLVLLPASAAHAALPLDPTSGSTGTAARPTTADDDGFDADDDSDDSAAQDDSGESFDDDSTAADDSSSDDARATDDTGSTPAKARSGSGSSSAKASAAPSGRKKATAAPLKAPRGVIVRLAAFDRIVVGWKPGSRVKLTRWVVTLRAGSTGRLLYLGRLARSATFTALKPGVRYTATVSATASGGRIASASIVIRTPSLEKAAREVAREQARVDRAVRLAKLHRFG